MKVEDAIILWDWAADGDGRVINLIVTEKGKQTRQTDKLPASAGACDDGWMSGIDVHSTPIGIYASIATNYGFKDTRQAVSVLREFAKIDGQTWVRDLLVGAGIDDLPNDD